jgi:hypothetical protein
MNKTKSHDSGLTCPCVRQGECRKLQSPSVAYTQNFKSRKTRLDQRLNSSLSHCDFYLILSHLFKGLGSRITNKHKK